MPTDVTDEAAVQALARRAIESFGKIDVWVNNAGVLIFSRFEDTPPEAYRRVIETNVFGYVHGARAVVPHFRARGHGVLVNVASVAGKAAMPYANAYVASKFAVVGLSESLRQELVDAPGIRVCTIMPGAIDTPLFQHAANYLGRAAKPPSPVYDPADVARAIARVAERPERERFVGGAARVLVVLHGLAPGLYERVAGRFLGEDQFLDVPSPRTPGNLFDPMPTWTTAEGGWRAKDATRSRRRSGAVLATALPAIALSVVGMRRLAARRAA